METKIDLSSITVSGEDDHMGGYEYTDTITLNSLNHSNTVIGGGFSDPYYGAVPNVTIGSGAVSGAIGSNTYPYIVSTTGGPYTINGGAGTGYPWSTSISPKLRLDGEGADIEVNGVSLMDMIGKIEERLNILHPNEKLEAEWEELRALGEQYRKLEQHIKDKQATWDKLKAMPPPVVD
jgi:hypothetical protein